MWTLLFVVQLSVARTRVLVTTFDPFQGGKANVTQEIARELQARAGDVEIVVCNLPVEFRNGVKKAHACIEESKPDLVVSLGETNCRIQLETRGRNQLGGAFMDIDNAGFQPRGEKIVEDAGRFEPATLPLARMYCALNPEERRYVDPSPSLGTYVCNEIAYSLARQLKGRTPFGFIHVPTQESCLDADSASTVAAKLTKMLGVAVADLKTPGCAGGRGVASHVADLRGVADHGCALEAARKFERVQHASDND